VPPAVSVADASGAAELLSDVVSDDDASLTLVASLTDDVDLETVREAGLASRGGAERAVTHMSAGELRELGRLLKEELARSGA
jgi:MOSC domain-containing protein YiiM